jgi:hypothetical protein
VRGADVAVTQKLVDVCHGVFALGPVTRGEIAKQRGLRESRGREARGGSRQHTPLHDDLAGCHLRRDDVRDERLGSERVILQRLELMELGDVAGGRGRRRIDLKCGRVATWCVREGRKRRRAGCTGGLHVRVIWQIEVGHHASVQARKLPNNSPHDGASRPRVVAQLSWL